MPKGSAADSLEQEYQGGEERGIRNVGIRVSELGMQGTSEGMESILKMDGLYA